MQSEQSVIGASVTCVFTFNQVIALAAAASDTATATATAVVAATKQHITLRETISARFTQIFYL